MQNPLIGNSPDLKIRYANGLGDIVACFLHSKVMHSITVLITGNEKPCMACSARRNALNILFPIPFWKLFFDSKNELLETLAADYRASGYKVSIDEKIGKLSVTKAVSVENK